MSRALPDHPNLEHLKKQAKERLPDLRQQHPEARLADAQHAVAREYGFLNWPALKAHLDAISGSAPPVPAVPASLFVGRWTANLARSRRHPANLFQRATIEFAVDGDVVTIADAFVDEAGREEHGRNIVHVDGIERAVEHGYAVVACWRGSHTLEVVVKKADEVVGRATYSVSPDGRLLTTTDLTGEQVIVLDRAISAASSV
jgi:hypothetical protein